MNARFVKPLDIVMVDDVATRIGRIVTVEDGQKQGGFGSAVAEYISQHHSRTTDLKIHGIDDIYVDHATQNELWSELQLDATGIAHVVKEFLAESVVKRALT